MIEKIGNLYYDKWMPGFDGNICSTKGIYPTITLSNHTGGTTNTLTSVGKDKMAYIEYE